MGWKRRPGQKVTLTFEFDSVRELESAAFHVSNHFTSGVRVGGLGPSAACRDGSILLMNGTA